MKRNPPQKLSAPVAFQQPHKVVSAHGTRQDPFFWLSQRDNPQVIEHLEKENAYTAQVLKPVRALQTELYEEMRGRIIEKDMSVPYQRGSYEYYVRFEQGQEYPIYCRKKLMEKAQEEIMLDVNELAQGHAYYQVGQVALHSDENTLAFAVDTQGRRIFDIHFKDLKTGSLLSQSIENVTGNMTWSEGSRHLLYSKQDPTTLRSYQIWSYDLDSNGSKLLFEEEDATYRTYVQKTRSKEMLIIMSVSTLTTEARFVHAATPLGDWKVFLPRERGHEYHLDHGQDGFFVLSNKGAPNFQVWHAPLGSQSMGDWKLWVEENKEGLIESIEVFEDLLVVEEVRGGNSEVSLLRQAQGEREYLKFQETVYSVSVGMNPNFKITQLRYHYESLTSPEGVYEYDLQTQQHRLLKQKQLQGGFNASDYQSERRWVESKDGVKIPLSLVYKKGEALEDRPVLLYGYGSYGHSLLPSFSPNRLSLLDRNMVMAIAHIRGGSEMGRSWYETGKLLQKQNTFDDFIACGDYLKTEGIAKKEGLYAMGGSAGGLLMGAVTNKRSDLFSGVVAQVPFVDVVTTMLDDSIPLTTFEYDEWGNPASKEFYDYMLSYSPYDNVEDKAYPAMLVTTGLHDSQVQYWEPAKWVQKLRIHNKSQAPILLYTNMDVGHGGASGRFEYLREVAREYSFVLGLESGALPGC